jgi:transcriptional regulator with XRE-family HTH domain
MFREFIKSRRLELQYTLREFCRKWDFESSYISRLENGILPAPRKEKVLQKLAHALEIKKKSKQWDQLVDLAHTDRGEIPKDIIMEYPKIMEYLPAFFRTLRKDKITKKEINKLMKTIFNGHPNSKKRKE